MSSKNRVWEVDCRERRSGKFGTVEQLVQDGGSVSVKMLRWMSLKKEKQYYSVTKRAILLVIRPGYSLLSPVWEQNVAMQFEGKEEIQSDGYQRRTCRPKGRRCGMGRPGVWLVSLNVAWGALLGSALKALAVPSSHWIG